LLDIDCPGRPAPDTVAGRAWEVIADEVADGLHGDLSGFETGVARAVARLAAAGLLADECRPAEQCPPE
jgi:hypothetical protein